MKELPQVRRLVSAVAGVWLLGAAVGAGQQTAGDAVLLAYGRMGTGPRPALIGVRVNDSIDGEVWSLQFHDASLQGQRRLVTIREGKVAGDSSEVVWPFTQGSYDALRPNEVSLPVATLRRVAAERAARNNLKPASLTYVLNHSLGEPTARWEIYLVDRKRIIIGHIQIDAATGALIREAFTAAGASATPQPPAQIQGAGDPAKPKPKGSTSIQRRRPSGRQSRDTGREVANLFGGIGDEIRRIFH